EAAAEEPGESARDDFATVAAPRDDTDAVAAVDDSVAAAPEDDDVSAQDERKEPSKTERIMPWRSSRPVSRRARKAWAVGRNAEFAKSDAALAEQWQRTP